MNKFLILVLIIILAGLVACGRDGKQTSSNPDTSQDLSSTTEYKKGQVVYVAPARLNMRVRDNRESEQIRLLEQGTRLVILERGREDTISELTDYWYRVDTGNEVGWVFGTFITLHSEVQQGSSSKQVKLTLPDGGEYVGQVKDGKPHGEGTVMLGCFNEEGTRYTGQWQNGKKHGQGRLEWNGGSLEGQWRNDRMHGQGTMLDHGFKYVGQWLNGEMHGQGREYDDGRLIRSGTWRNGEFVEN